MGGWVGGCGGGWTQAGCGREQRPHTSHHPLTVELLGVGGKGAKGLVLHALEDGDKGGAHEQQGAEDDPVGGGAGGPLREGESEVCAGWGRVGRR